MNHKKNEGEVENIQLHLSLLIIEDNDVFRELLAERLRMAGCTAHAVSCVEAAMAFLKINKVDVVLSDICLPHISGLGFLKIFKTRGELTPVIMMTAYSNTEIAGECLLAGADDFIFKPFRAESLILLLEKLQNKIDRWHALGIIKGGLK